MDQPSSFHIPRLETVNKANVNHEQQFDRPFK